MGTRRIRVLKDYRIMTEFSEIWRCITIVAMPGDMVGPKGIDSEKNNVFRHEFDVGDVIVASSL